MTERELRTFLDQVKPLGLTILFVMANLVVPQVDVSRIARIMRTTRQRLAPTFEQLVDHGYLAEVVGGRHPHYRLTDKVRQLALFDLTALTGMTLAGQPAQSEPRALTGMLHAEQPAPGESHVCDTMNDDVNKINVTAASVVVVVDQDLATDLATDLAIQQQQQQQVTLKNLTSDSADRRAGVLRACVAAGIGYPASHKIADDEWCTADRVLRAVRQCRLEERWKNPIGQAIYRLQDHIEPKTTTELDAWERSLEEDEPEAEAISAAAKIPVVEVDPDTNRRARLHWNAAQGELSLQMTKPTFETWVKPCQMVGYVDGKYTIATPSVFIKDWLERKLLLSIKRSLAGITGQAVAVEFVVANVTLKKREP